MSKQLDEIRNTCQYCVTTTSVTRSLRNWVRNQAFQSLRSGSRVRVQHVLLVLGGAYMSDRDKVWPTGLTEAESEEIHRHLIQGTQIFGMIAAFAHLLAYIYSPWLH